MTSAELDALADRLADRLEQRLAPHVAELVSDRLAELFASCTSAAVETTRSAVESDVAIDRNQAAKLLGCSVTTIDRMRASGLLTSLNGPNHAPRYSRRAVLGWKGMVVKK